MPDDEHTHTLIYIYIQKHVQFIHFHLYSISLIHSFCLLNGLVKNLIENAIVLLRLFLFVLQRSRFLRYRKKNIDREKEKEKRTHFRFGQIEIKQ